MDFVTKIPGNKTELLSDGYVTSAFWSEKGSWGMPLRINMTFIYKSAAFVFLECFCSGPPGKCIHIFKM